MKKVFLRIAKWGGIGFAALLALTVVMQIVDPEGMKKARDDNAKASAARAEKAAASKEKTDKVFQHGFLTGFTLAKDGAVKPNGDQVDALARKAAKALEDEGGLGFKMQWKDGFWMGWNKGD